MTCPGDLRRRQPSGIDWLDSARDTLVPEVERMAALPPQVPLIAIAQGWSKDLSWVFKSCLDSGLTIRCNQNCDLA